jgi:hypothetical protein
MTALLPPRRIHETECDQIRGSSNLLKAAAELSQQAERLGVEVAAFLAKARAA